MKTVLLMSLVVLSAAGTALAGTAENPQDGDKLITVRSENDESVTVSDLYSYSGPKGTGTRTTHLAKGDSNDDIHIAPHGTKSFYLGQCQSYTISFMYQGKEIEMDGDWGASIGRQSRACFDSSFGGLFAVDYDGSGGEGALPPLEIQQLIAGGGHIVSGVYDWITFYNTTASGGMIERDASGNPISPVLPDGSLVTAVFLYDVVPFEVVEGDNCPSADLTGDCFVDFNDFALMADQWLSGPGYIPDDMAFVPGGTFSMGDNLGDGWSGELPVHTVTVDSFHMGKYEITNRQYCDYLNSAEDGGEIKVDGGIVYASSDRSNSYSYCDTHSHSTDSQIDYSGGVFTVRTKSGRDMSNDPMVRVSWYGVAAYCNWRSQQEGKEQCYNLSTWTCDFNKKGYRLATEAEWEYAARGGLSGRRFPWGDMITHSQANYYSYWKEGHTYLSYDVSPTEGYHPTWNDGVWPYTSPVGSFAANGYGLYDMAGNVWEWCNDWYDSDYYDYSPTSNPTGPISGSYRVLRGGHWYYSANYCRVAYRSYCSPYGRGHIIGFRCVLDF